MVRSFQKKNRPTLFTASRHARLNGTIIGHICKSSHRKYTISQHFGWKQGGAIWREHLKKDDVKRLNTGENMLTNSVLVGGSERIFQNILIGNKQKSSKLILMQVFAFKKQQSTFSLNMTRWYTMTVPSSYTVLDVLRLDLPLQTRSTAAGK